MGIRQWLEPSWHMLILFLSYDLTQARVNTNCDPTKELDGKHPSTLAEFFFCDNDGLKKIGTCPQNTIFDETLKRCTADYNKKRSKRNSFVIVGLPCQENIDCLTVDGGAFCDTTKRCDCLPTHVNIAGFCWRKINPGETGCQYQEQCNSVWPGAFCTAGGVCNCPDSQPPHRTRDGSVCVGQGRCPTNGFNSKHKGQDGQESPCILPDRCALTEYDCFCSPPVPPAAGCTSTTYCCPSRALACIMPKEEGIFSGGTTQNKWYFNSATGNCESLAYRGDGGNANNFDSKGQCESYCKTSCPRGRPRYGDPDMSDPLLRPAPMACASASSSSTCGSTEDYFCNTATTSVTSYCCPSVKNICGLRGGVEPGMTASVPDSGEQGFRLPSRQRYYYDTASASCKAFTYYGQGGNYNNFDSENQCKQYCSRSLCIAGEPLKDTSQSSIRCGSAGSGFCPSKYECSNDGYCCPTRDFVCSQPQAVGGCVNYVSRWWFNPDTRSCVSFTYSGCQGNFNNFGTYDECQSYCGSSSAAPKCPQGQGGKDFNGAYIVCAGTSTSVSSCPAGYFCYYDNNRYGCCPTKTQTCEFDTSDSGTPCVTPVSRWFYNSQARSCETFTYNGCDGNSNNFATKIDCQDYCGVGGCPEGGEPFRESNNGQYRACASGGSECPTGYACSQVTLGTSTVYTYCCPTRDTICRLPQDQGQSCGTGNLNRFYFNSVTRTCEVFVYRGCSGNRNNFPTIEQCLSYCNSAGCAAGQVALQDLSTRRLTTCSVSTGAAGCPTAYNCVVSALLGQNICCGSNAAVGTCPTGQSAYMDSFANSPQQCQQNTDANCPTGYFCQYSATQLNSFCCGSAIVQCPRGGTVNLNSFGQPEQCTPNAPNNCSPGFECQPITVVIVNITSTTGYCCGTPNPCGQGFSTQFRQNVAVNCDPNIANICQKPYTCQRSIGGQGYCCVSITSGTSVCAIGKSPYLVQSAPIVCTSGGVHAGTGCPLGFQCDLYAPTNTFYCCGTNNVTISPLALRCPPGYVVLQPEQPCGTSPDTCPSGNFCSFDSSNKRYICCGKNVTAKPIEIFRNEASLCPAGSPLPGIVCSINAQCPTGYMCKPGLSANVCCPSPSSTCSLSMAAGTMCSNSTAIQKYFYNPVTRNCQSYTYQGCGGNDNSFASQQLCEDFCMPSLCNRGSPQYLSGQSIQSCSAPGQCQHGYECSPPVFGGGSSLCCPSRSTVCSSNADPGRPCTIKGSSPVMRWHYNDNTKSCQQFSFHGCHGNGNNFDSQSECMSFCTPPSTTTMAPPPTPPPPPPPPTTSQPMPIEVCPHGQVAQVSPGSHHPQLCNLGVGASGCSNGYSCTYSPAERNYYCCGSSFASGQSGSSNYGGSNGCPAGAAYLYPLTKTPLSCSQNGAQCPSGYTCMKSTDFPGSLCCSVTAVHQSVHDTEDEKRKKTDEDSEKISCTTKAQCEEKMESKNAFCNDKKTCSCSSPEIMKNGTCVIILKPDTQH